MAKYRQGESGNPRGRPQGSKNFITSSFREELLSAISIESILADIEKCVPAQRAALKIKLLEFVQPKLKNIEFVDVTSIEALIQMSPEERRKRIMELKLKHNERSERTKIA
ncbi:MAG TPA: DUF5681 domain-containing protein [Cyclobacteriaceae bacterium]|nr:DUF5681 domain-containing protein [Cyclobacteriaceae bacterium]